MAENEKEMKVAKDMIPADLAIVPFVSIKGNYIITSILWLDTGHSVKRLITPYPEYLISSCEPVL